MPTIMLFSVRCDRTARQRNQHKYLESEWKRRKHLLNSTKHAYVVREAKVKFAKLKNVNLDKGNGSLLICSTYFYIYNLSINRQSLHITKQPFPCCCAVFPDLLVSLNWAIIFITFVLICNTHI